MKNFDLLYDYLSAIDIKTLIVTLKLDDIERISKVKLCDSARRYFRYYWRDDRNNPVIRTIHKAGFRLSSLNVHFQSLELKRMAKCGYEGDFCFHSVGQGLFYTGIIRDNIRNLFTFAYDCGSTAKANCLEAINDFKSCLKKDSDGKSHLDLLVISHFHADHVRGLPELLKDMDVDTVIFPYSDPDLLKLELIDFCDDELRELYEYGPVAWFEKKGVKRIITNHIDRNDMEYSNRPMPRETRLAVDANAIREVHGNIMIARNRIVASLAHDLWSFSFDFRKISNKAQQNTLARVRAFLQHNSITGVIASSGLSTRIRKQLGASLLSNDSSVLMMHKPMNAESIECRNDCNVIYTEDILNSVTLLTGDIDSSRYSYRLLEEIYSEYDKDGYHNIVLFPHHGSKYNDIQKFKRLNHADIVLSYGIQNRYDHPSDEVKDNLAFVSVNDKSSYSYKLLT